MRLLAVAALVLSSLPAMAADVPVNWTNATKAVDGSNITVSSTTIVWGTSAAALSNSQTTNVKAVQAPGNSTSITLPAGTWYVAAYHSAPSGKSDLSAVVSVVVPPAAPQPPTGLTVTAPTAYTLIKQRDALAMVPVGTVPVGTPCIQNHTVNGLYAVPRSSVSFNGSVKPEIVFASCGSG